MIRPALPADQARIEAIVEAAYRPYLERMDRKPAPMVDDYAGRIAAGETHVLEEDGEILGILVLEPGEDFLLLDNIAVDPAHQGGGLGRKLMSFAESEALRQGYASIRLYTNEKMTENIAFYGRLGYRETGREVLRELYAVHMRKELSAGA